MNANVDCSVPASKQYGEIMSIEIKYDQNRNMLIIAISGTSDFEDYKSALETITRSGDYPPNVRTLWDLRNADLSFANFTSIKKVVGIRTRFKQRDNCRVALVTSSNLQFGLCRMFQMLLEGKLSHELAVFRDYEEGEKWLIENQMT